MSIPCNFVISNHENHIILFIKKKIPQKIPKIPQNSPNPKLETRGMTNYHSPNPRGKKIDRKLAFLDVAHMDQNDVKNSIELPFFTKTRPCIIQVSKCPLLRTYPNKNAQTDRHATLSEKWARQIGNWDSIRVSYLPILYTITLLYMDRHSDGQHTVWWSYKRFYS